MPFAYYERLSPSRKQTYRKSDAIHELALPRGLDLGALAVRLESELGQDKRALVQSTCQALLDALSSGFHVPGVRVSVRATRPRDHTGELHGLYEPAEGAAAAKISVWMRTAQRKQVVAFRTFLRTLVHELCHHLDYELFLLPETFHTEGFYRRESSLAKQVFQQMMQPVDAPRPNSTAGSTNTGMKLK
jgi:hypothetical protein